MPLRNMAVLVLGFAVLAAILYYASTVDARGPAVVAISLTQHLSDDADLALTTTSIEVDFSEPVEHASAQAAFAIDPPIDGAFSWSATSLTFTPAARLPLRTEFEVSIGPGVRDRAGNEMVGVPERFTFVTVGNPTVVGSDPLDAAGDVALDAPIVVDFSTLMDTASVEGAIEVTPTSEVALRWSRERLTVVPVAGWEANRRYSLTIGVGARDQAGTPLERPFRLSFRTVAAGLTVDAIVPADGVAGISVITPIALVFRQPLDPESVHDDLLTITPAVAGSLDVIAPPGAGGLTDAAARILRFQPSGPLDPNTTYQVTLGPGLLGADGTGMPTGMSWTFTTGAPTATLSNQVVFVSNRAGIANLWAMNPDGSNQRQLSAELSPVISYAVSPDGRAYLTGDGAGIVWQGTDGTARRLLTEPGVIEFDAAYSPDGTVITFGRADPVLGSSLGLWMRDADGSDARPIELPSGSLASPSAGQATPVPLLRAPRMSPDGTALAFVDEAGRVGILDLELQQHTSAPFVALSEPTWLPDGSGVLVAGLTAGSAIDPMPYRPHSAVAILDPASRELGATQVAVLQVVSLGRFATSVSATAFGSGASRPAVDAAGRYAFVRLAGAETGGGDLWVTSALGATGEAIAVPGPGTRSASFAPEPGSMVIGAEPGGIWLLSLGSGQVQRLTADGWLPHWLP
ncbi:MAG: Ig-like domain-containing protein [Chloroflexota bacterium]